MCHLADDVVVQFGYVGLLVGVGEQLVGPRARRVGGEVLGGEGEHVVRLGAQHRLHEVGHERAHLRMLAQVLVVLVLQLILQHTHRFHSLVVFIAKIMNVIANFTLTFLSSNLELSCMSFSQSMGFLATTGLAKRSSTRRAQRLVINNLKHNTRQLEMILVVIHTDLNWRRFGEDANDGRIAELQAVDHVAVEREVDAPRGRLLANRLDGALDAARLALAVLEREPHVAQCVLHTKLKL